MQGGFDRTKSLQELEHHDWGEPTYDSYLVTTIHRLRRKPLADFTMEDLRIMIGQQIGLAYLVPLAIERLELNPFACGDYYVGDLLAMVLKVDEAFWLTHPDSFKRVRSVVGRLHDLLPSLDEVDRQTASELLKRVPESWSKLGG